MLILLFGIIYNIHILCNLFLFFDKTIVYNID
jgi:hypothetical protein